MTTPSRDEFDQWLADPVTVFVMDGLRALARKQEDAFAAAAWSTPSRPEEWDALRLYRERATERSKAYSDLAAITIEDAYGANGLDAPPKPEEPA